MLIMVWPVSAQVSSPAASASTETIGVELSLADAVDLDATLTVAEASVADDTLVVTGTLGRGRNPAEYL